MTEGPEPTEFDIGCFFHGFEGDITPEKRPYRSCGECGHIYWTEEQLISEYNSEGEKAFWGSAPLPDDVLSYGWTPELDSSEIFYCIWCAHDF